MKVIAATGLKVPTEANPREYITDAEAVEIEPTAYYLRRLADNELREVAPVQPDPSAGADASAKPPKSAPAAK